MLFIFNYFQTHQQGSWGLLAAFVVVLLVLLVWMVKGK